MNGLASTIRCFTGYSYRNGELHAWYQPIGGLKRWVDTDARVHADDILKGNADLVPAEHAYLRAVDADFEARR